MYVIMGVHHPKPGMEKSLLDTQEKFGNAERGHRGADLGLHLEGRHHRRDHRNHALGHQRGLRCSAPDMDKAIQGVDFRSVDASMEIYRGSPVVWALG